MSLIVVVPLMVVTVVLNAGQNHVVEQPTEGASNNDRLIHGITIKLSESSGDDVAQEKAPANGSENGPGAGGDGCTIPGGTECSNGRLRQCRFGSAGRLSWSDPVPCADGFCADSENCGSCASLPPAPRPYQVKVGPIASEDLTFDDAGNLIGAGDEHIWKSPYNGAPKLFVPGAGELIAGLRTLPGGELVYAEMETNTLFRVDRHGAKTPVLSGFSNPNGLEVDLNGFVYVTEQDSGRVRRIDPLTGEFTILADNLNNPNGISFNPDYSLLYISSFGGGTVHALEVNAEGRPGKISLLADLESHGGSNSGLDGMGVDICGNVYVCQYELGVVWRISPDGTRIEKLVDLDSPWIPNLQWGSGMGGWDRHTLYVNDFKADVLYEVPVGVPGKHRNFP